MPKCKIDYAAGKVFDIFQGGVFFKKMAIKINCFENLLYFLKKTRHKLFYTLPQRNIMAKKDKKQVLKEQGVLNRHSIKVIDSMFKDNSFFDADDLAQVKYEMVRQVVCEGKSVSEAAGNFGMSRPTVYQAREAIEREGLLGLAPKKSGPQTRHKLTVEIMAFVHEKIAEDSPVNSQALADLITEKFAVSVHPRSIERALEAQKKNEKAPTERGSDD